MNFKKYHVSKNWFDKDNTTIYSAYFDVAGSWLLSSDSKSVKMPCQPNTQYTLSVPNSLAVFRVYESNNANIEPSSTSPPRTTEITRGTNISQYTFTTSSTAQIILFQGSNGAVTEWFNGLMLNTGSEALPFEPHGNTWTDVPHYIMGTSTDTITTLPADIYANDATATVGLQGNMSQTGTPTPQNPIQPQECGDLETTGEHTGQYKIPILSNSTTTPVYLGEVQTTRKIGKLVLDGTENVEARTSSVTGYTVMRLTVTGYLRNTNYTPISTHYLGQQAIIGIQEITENNRFAFLVSSSDIDYMYIYDNRYTTADDFKAYLAQQYSAGTPVCIWYVLATPETAVVNEPIRKIGDYADEVSGITIPTIAGANTLSVDTTLQPSEVSVNYKGWHPVTDVHERENGAWT